MYVHMHHNVYITLIASSTCLLPVLLSQIIHCMLSNRTYESCCTVLHQQHKGTYEHIVQYLYILCISTRDSAWTVLHHYQLGSVLRLANVVCAKYARANYVISHLDCYLYKLRKQYCL